MKKRRFNTPRKIRPGADSALDEDAADGIDEEPPSDSSPPQALKSVQMHPHQARHAGGSSELMSEDETCASGQDGLEPAMEDEPRAASGDESEEQDERNTGNLNARNLAGNYSGHPHEEPLTQSPNTATRASADAAEARERGAGGDVGREDDPGRPGRTEADADEADESGDGSSANMDDSMLYHSMDDDDGGNGSGSGSGGIARSLSSAITAAGSSASAMASTSSAGGLRTGYASYTMDYSIPSTQQHMIGSQDSAFADSQSINPTQSQSLSQSFAGFSAAFFPSHQQQQQRDAADTLADEVQLRGRQQEFQPPAAAPALARSRHSSHTPRGSLPARQHLPVLPASASSLSVFGSAGSRSEASAALLRHAGDSADADEMDAAATASSVGVVGVEKKRRNASVDGESESRTKRVCLSKDDSNPPLFGAMAIMDTSPPPSKHDSSFSADNSFDEFVNEEAGSTKTTPLLADRASSSLSSSSSSRNLPSVPFSSPGAASAIVAVHPTKRLGTKASPSAATSLVTALTRKKPTVLARTLNPQHTGDLASAQQDAEAAVEMQFGAWTPRRQCDFIHRLVSKLSPSQVVVVNSFLVPLSYRDFLLLLPLDVAQRILHHLDFQSLGRAERVSRGWCQLVRSSSVWKHKFFGEFEASIRLVSASKSLGLRSWRSMALNSLLTERRAAANWESGNYSLSKTKCKSNGVYCIHQHLKHVVSGHRDWKIRIWLLADEQLRFVRVLEGHTGSVLSLHCDSERIVSCSSDKTLRVWDWKGTEHYVLKSHSSSVLQVVFNDERIVCCSKDNLVHVFRWGSDRFSASLERVITNPTHSVNVVELTSTLIVAASSDCALRMWNAATGAMVGQIAGVHQSAIACIHVYKDRVVTGASDRLIHLSSMKTFSVIRSFAGHTDLIRCIRMNDDYLVSGSYDCSIRVWDVNGGNCLHVFSEHRQRVVAIRFDKSHLISTSQDDTIIVWSFINRECQPLFHGDQIDEAEDENGGLLDSGRATENRIVKQAMSAKLPTLSLSQSSLTDSQAMIFEEDSPSTPVITIMDSQSS